MITSSLSSQTEIALDSLILKWHLVEFFFNLIYFLFDLSIFNQISCICLLKARHPSHICIKHGKTFDQFRLCIQPSTFLDVKQYKGTLLTQIKLIGNGHEMSCIQKQKLLSAQVWTPKSKLISLKKTGTNNYKL